MDPPPRCVGRFFPGQEEWYTPRTSIFPRTGRVPGRQAWPTCRCYTFHRGARPGSCLSVPPIRFRPSIPERKPVPFRSDRGSHVAKGNPFRSNRNVGCEVGSCPRPTSTLDVKRNHCRGGIAITSANMEVRTRREGRERGRRRV